MTPLQHKSIPWFESPVGVKAMQEVYATMTHHSADSAALITRCRFRLSARRRSATTGVVLLLHSEIYRFDEQRWPGKAACPG